MPSFYSKLGIMNLDLIQTLGDSFGTWNLDSGLPLFRKPYAQNTWPRWIFKASSTFFWSDVRIASIQVDASNIKSFIKGIINIVAGIFFLNIILVFDSLLVWYWVFFSELRKPPFSGNRKYFLILQPISSVSLWL